jgi:hypothetical protein
MFNRKLYISIVLLFAMIAVLPSCKHTPEDVGGPELNIVECQPTIDSMRQWYFFRPGSWWVYQEEATGTLDTLNAIFYDDGLSGGGFSQIVTRTKSKLDGYTYEYYFNDSWTRPTRLSSICNLMQIGLSKYIPGNLEGEGYLFYYPMTFDDYLSVIDFSSTDLPVGKSRIDHYYEQYVINEQDTLRGAYRYVVDYDVANGQRMSEYTWVKGVGLIRKKYQMEDGSALVWNLIDYEVVN